MQKRFMETAREWVSLLGFGCMRFPQKDGRTDPVAVQRMVDYAKSHGVNYFDTAYVYGDGESERAIAQALRKYPRDSYFLADKLPVWLAKEEADLEKLFNTSLERLGTDSIDFYLLHALDKEHWADAKKFNAIEFVKRKKAEGKIRYIGFSFHDEPALFSEIVGAFDWDFVQIQLNYLDWELQRAKELYALLEQKRIPCVVMEPVRGGGLANPPRQVAEIFEKAESPIPNPSHASWALRFCASLPQVKVILSGMSDFDQVADNVRTLSDFEPLGANEYATIDRAVAAIHAQPQIGCTGCRYCMPCPKNVDIPGVFEVYNDYMRLYDKGLLSFHMNIRLKNSGPALCVGCKICEKKCPQHIPVSQELKKVLETREKAGI